MTDEHHGEEQEGFGESSLGEAQSSDPALDPEMIDSEHEGDEQNVGDADEQLGIDPDAGPASTEDELDPGGSRDQAEG
jgi:hypothetical protein